MTAPFAAHILDQVRRLLELHPELAEDEILREDMIEGATDAHSFLRMLERKRQTAECLTEAIAVNISILSERKARIGRREDAVRHLMLKIMEAAHLYRLELPEATLSVRKATDRVVVMDDVMVPHEFCRVRYAPDKIKIRQYLESGNKPNWAAIVPGEPSVAIRTK